MSQMDQEFQSWMEEVEGSEWSKYLDVLRNKGVDLDDYEVEFELFDQMPDRKPKAREMLQRLYLSRRRPPPTWRGSELLWRVMFEAPRKERAEDEVWAEKEVYPLLDPSLRNGLKFFTAGFKWKEVAIKRRKGADPATVAKTFEQLLISSSRSVGPGSDTFGTDTPDKPFPISVLEEDGHNPNEPTGADFTEDVLSIETEIGKAPPTDTEVSTGTQNTRQKSSKSFIALIAFIVGGVVTGLAFQHPVVKDFLTVYTVKKSTSLVSVSNEVEQHCIGSTADMIVCSYAILEKQNAELDKTYNDLIFRLRAVKAYFTHKDILSIDDTPEVRELRDVQGAWTIYRDAECDWQRGSGGSIAPLISLGCRIHLTEQRRKDLALQRDYLKDLGYGE